MELKIRIQWNEMECGGAVKKATDMVQQKKETLGDLLIKNGRRLTFPQTSAVSSARAGLTSLFGMGRGEHRLYNHPNNGFDIWNKTYKGKLCTSRVHGLPPVKVGFPTESLRVISTARL